MAPSKLTIARARSVLHKALWNNDLRLIRKNSVDGADYQGHVFARWDAVPATPGAARSKQTEEGLLDDIICNFLGI